MALFESTRSGKLVLEPFKTNLSPALVSCIADHLAKHMSGFDRAGFEDGVFETLDTLELKQRAQLIADQLHLALPTKLKARHKILRAMLHPMDDDSGASDERGVRGWGMMALTRVVGQHGLSDYEGALRLLKEMTSRFSSEFDVRPFLLDDQGRALAIMSRWVDDPDHHVRRLVSEGTRPRLPWGMQLPSLIADPSPMLPLLTALRDDPHEYVRRSVANHLNDIAKDHPDLVADLAKSWMQGADANRKKLVRHACRTLVKRAHPGALAALGVAPPKLDVIAVQVLTPRVAFGGALRFTVSLTSTSKRSQALVVDYVLHFKKANGTRAAKVFKWKKMTLAAGQSLQMERKHPIRPITTRRYYPGTQAISLQINGRAYGVEEFELDGL